MRPDQLRPEDFGSYAPQAREFAIAHLALLQQLPITICPSFLQQVQQFDTSFPAEQGALRRQCDALTHLPPDQLGALLKPFQEIRVPAELEASEWIQAPAVFIQNLSSHLWASGQLDRFRAASVRLFEAVPPASEAVDRLTMIVVGRDAPASAQVQFKKLHRKGVLLTGLQTEAMSSQIFEAFRKHAAQSDEPYAHWYVDGGEPWPEAYGKIAGAIAVNYPQLDPVRVRTLQAMEQIVKRGNADAEVMHARLTLKNAKDLDTDAVTTDPVLRRFYTELFTESSGPQIFSTTFVQWTGRELARRAQPRTLLLRYAPRQRYRQFNELLHETTPASMDPEGSLRDAEMGAYYTWVEMNRITTAGKGVLVVWREGTSQAVMIAKGAAAGTECSTSLTLEQALQSFA